MAEPSRAARERNALAGDSGAALWRLWPSGLPVSFRADYGLR
ncbi:hypothetical protein BZL30_0610 [Mycobacterium kansasii]|uniref:Uncharacterized protein n=1 Tax=Mycobacterium kansasii TaxID=1768 RepID=A0A1V3XV39_MYCKA|nr:hypothetical protein BZL30_0610 [Mycobacterium kansasii]